MPKFILFFSVAVIIILIIFFSQNGFETTNVVETTQITNDGNNFTPPVIITQKSHILTFEENLKVKFTKMGWTSKAADAVIVLNSEWLSIQQEENPKGFETQLYLLKQLGKNSDFMPLFEERPETASLLAAAYHPEQLAEILEKDECYDDNFHNVYSIE